MKPLAPGGVPCGLFSDLLGALVNLRAQKTRTLLTAPGSILGVGSVITMLAIWAGARDLSLEFRRCLQPASTTIPGCR